MKVRMVDELNKNLGLGKTLLRFTRNNRERDCRTGGRVVDEVNVNLALGGTWHRFTWNGLDHDFIRDRSSGIVIVRDHVPGRKRMIFCEPRSGLNSL